MHPFRTRAAVLATGLLLAACGSGGGTAGVDLAGIDVVATAAGQEIPGEVLEERVAAQRDVALEGLEGEALSQAEGELVRQALTAEIQLQLVLAAAEDLDVEVTEDELDAAYADAVERAGGEEAFQGILDEQGLDEETARDSVRVDALVAELRDVLAQDVDEAAVQAAFDARPAEENEQATVRHILLETEEDAEAALARLEDGEDFAELAMELSTGPSGPEGGALGTQPRGVYVPEFEEVVWSDDTVVGEVYGPVQTQFGFHLIRVDEKVEVALADVEEELTAQLVDQAFSDFLDMAFAAEVTVDDSIGSWDAETTMVVAPAPAGDGAQGDDEE